MARLNITNISEKIKEMIEKDRKLTGQSQREYIENLVKEEHEKLKNDAYILKKIKEKKIN
jgi:ferritin